MTTPYRLRIAELENLLEDASSERQLLQVHLGRANREVAIVSDQRQQLANQLAIRSRTTLLPFISEATSFLNPVSASRTIPMPSILSNTLFPIETPEGSNRYNHEDNPEEEDPFDIDIARSGTYAHNAEDTRHQEPRILRIYTFSDDQPVNEDGVLERVLGKTPDDSSPLPKRGQGRQNDRSALCQISNPENPGALEQETEKEMHAFAVRGKDMRDNVIPVSREGQGALGGARPGRLPQHDFREDDESAQDLWEEISQLDEEDIRLISATLGRKWSAQLDRL